MDSGAWAYKSSWGEGSVQLINNKRQNAKVQIGISQELNEL